MHRRTFLARLGGLALVPNALAAATSARTATATAAKPRLGIQLYTLRDDAQKNLERTLASIAEIGYTDVELLQSMHNFGMPAAQLRRVLDRLHLRAPSTHIGTEELDDLSRTLDDAHVLGHQYVVLASLPGEAAGNLDAYRRMADRLNTAGETARKAGLWIAFHDEAQDFKAVDGTVPYDVLVQRTDPNLVRLQLDTGNCAVGGGDPLAYLDKYADRYWLYHIKDAKSLGAPHDTDLGTGIVDFKRLLARMHHKKDALLYVEQESYAGTPLESARHDYQYFAPLLG
jgi:sugar phosphate isomerase/epimerase